MQTFLPMPVTSLADFYANARVLDDKRLNKQALEGWQIMMNLLELDPLGEHRAPKGWSKHPAVKMWRGYELALYMYVAAMVDEWIRRGHKSTIGDKALETIKIAHATGRVGDYIALPDWLEDTRTSESLSSSHRQALLCKDYKWYSQFGWEEDTGTAPTEYEYTWPVE